MGDGIVFGFFCGGMITWAFFLFFVRGGCFPGVSDRRSLERVVDAFHGSIVVGDGMVWSEGSSLISESSSL